LGHRLKIMPITINGSGTVTGIIAGGLPDGCIVTADIADNNVTTAKIDNISVTEIKIADDNVTTSKIADNNVTPAKLTQPLTLETSQSATGTKVDFTDIPSWVKRITVMFDRVSTNGTSFKQIQIGAGSVVASGYVGSASTITSAVATISFTTGFGIRSNASTDLIVGTSTITNISGDAWVCSTVTSNNAAETSLAGGTLDLGGTLDRVRITTVNGTNTFDAGTINIMYE
jgi:hypothetical protein